jgi:hypothetical protein
VLQTSTQWGTSVTYKHDAASDCAKHQSGDLQEKGSDEKRRARKQTLTFDERQGVQETLPARRTTTPPREKVKSCRVWSGLLSAWLQVSNQCCDDMFQASI